jgi:NAD(P)-dependent dehydrogenase (short-subunit alcohol dehydrogenase family)
VSQRVAGEPAGRQRQEQSPEPDRTARRGNRRSARAERGAAPSRFGGEQQHPFVEARCDRRLKGFQRSSAYSASKHAVIGLTRSAALDYATKGIRINAVCPGMVNTPMAAFVTKNYDPEIVRRMVAQEPIGRFGEPEEIAAAVVWLCSPAASFMVGHAMAVDGGILAG